MLGGKWTTHHRLCTEHEAHFDTYYRFMQQFNPDEDRQDHQLEWDGSVLSSVSNVKIRLVKTAWGRRFCMSTSSCMGWIPEAGKEGNVISVLYGSRLPVLLRPKGNAYEVIGTCYIHGIMDGEAVAAAEQPMQQIDLV